MKKRARGAPSGLVWRLYAVGIVQLLLVIAGAAAIAFALVHGPRWYDPQNISARIAPLIGKPKELAEALHDLREKDVQISLYDANRQLIATNVEPPLPVLDLDDERVPVPPPDLSLALQPPPPPPPEPSALSRLLPGIWPHDDGPHFAHGRGDGPHVHVHHGGHPPPGIVGIVGDGPMTRMGPPLAYARLIMPAGNGLMVVHMHPPKPSPLPPLLALGFGLVVIFVGAFLTARWIGRPIEQLTRTARALGSGDLRARSAIARTDELGELARTFDDMAERMEQLLLAEKELLANVAHELRTPLARIRVALEIAVEGDADAARGSLAEIAVDLSELEALINDVLTAARFEIAGGRTSESGFLLRRERVAPRALCERAVERFTAHHQGRVLELDCQSDVGDVEVDPVLFRRVLDNLLENADKYSPDPAQPIILQLKRDAGDALFAVIDRGTGIAEADLPRIFGAFFRAERSRSRGTGGVGLGLTLAKRIVDAHGGSITVESAIGQGTTVRVRVPLSA